MYTFIVSLIHKNNSQILNVHGLCHCSIKGGQVGMCMFEKMTAATQPN